MYDNIIKKLNIVFLHAMEIYREMTQKLFNDNNQNQLYDIIFAKNDKSTMIAAVTIDKQKRLQIRFTAYHQCNR